MSRIDDIKARIREYREAIASSEPDAGIMAGMAKIAIDSWAVGDIEHMLEENARLRAELEAAKADLAKAKPCGCCVHQYSGECILEECMDPCSAFIEGGKWEWRGIPANTPAQGATDDAMGGRKE